MAAVDPKAILAGRSRGRPSIGVILTIAVSSACLLVALGFMALEGPTFVVGLLLALLPLPLLLAGVLALDRLEPEPPDALVAALLWGAGVAALVAMIINTLGLTLIWVPLLGETEGFYATATFVAPVVEETLKGAVLFGMLWFRRHELNGPTDGIIYAAMVGLGFATVENISYYAATAQTGTLASTFVVRGLFTPLLHPLCTALTGVGVATAALREPGRGRVRPIILGLAGAIALHALWNGATRLGLTETAFAYGVGFIVLVSLLEVVRRDRQRIVAQIEQYLPQYLPTGVVTHADLSMLSTLRARHEARAWARNASGPGPYRAMRDYQQAATELAMLHRRYERGLVDQPAFEQRRQPLVLLMHLARQMFVGAGGVGR
jgi:RsiW-degrading membrane proteinase PrsW (M82 family)